MRPEYPKILLLEGLIQAALDPENRKIFAAVINSDTNYLSIYRANGEEKMRATFVSDDTVRLVRLIDSNTIDCHISALGEALNEMLIPVRNHDSGLEHMLGGRKKIYVDGVKIVEETIEAPTSPNYRMLDLD